MTRVGWCPGGRPVADMLTMYPGTTVVRIFVGPGDPLPAWDGPVLGPAVAAGAVVHVSFKTNSTADVLAWADKKPAGVLLLLTYAHEPEQQKYGDPTVDVFHARWSQLVAAFDGHPARAEILLGPVYTRFWWQAHPGDLRWLVTAPVDFHGWDVYNNGTGYRTPDDLLTIPRQIAARTGLPYLVAELGAVGDNSNRSAWMRAMVAALRADGALTACWFHKDAWDLSDTPLGQQTWRELTQEAAAMTRVKTLGGYPIEQHSSPNVGGTMSAHRGPVLHIAQGTYRGTISWQMNPDQRYGDGTKVTTSSSWVVGKNVGEWAQMCDSDRIAWCQRGGSRERSSIELAGYAPDGMTPWQIEACAQILAWEHQQYGVPLAVADNPSEDGLGHHSMDREWLGEEWGHDSCPGSGVLADKTAVVARAKQIINGETPEEDEMTPAQFAALLDDPAVARRMRALAVSYSGGGIPTGMTVLAVLNELLTRARAADGTDEQAIIAGVLAGLSPEKIAAAIPAEIAGQVADELAARLAS